MFFSILLVTPSGFKLILIFNLSSTSADPHFDERALFPCFATLTPMLAINKDEAVDILSVFFPSPPVPHVSIIFWGAFTFRDFSLKTYTPPAISSAVSPFLDKSVKNLKIKSSLIFPLIILRKIDLLSSKLKFLPFEMLFIKSATFFIINLVI